MPTGFRSFATTLRPSRNASNGMLPPPAVGSENGWVNESDGSCLLSKPRKFVLVCRILEGTVVTVGVWAKVLPLPTYRIDVLPRQRPSFSLPPSDRHEFPAYVGTWSGPHPLAGGWPRPPHGWPRAAARPPDVETVRCGKRRHRRSFPNALNTNLGNGQPFFDQPPALVLVRVVPSSTWTKQ